MWSAICGYWHRLTLWHVRLPAVPLRIHKVVCDYGASTQFFGDTLDGEQFHALYKRGRLCVEVGGLPVLVLNDHSEHLELEDFLRILREHHIFTKDDEVVK